MNNKEILNLVNQDNTIVSYQITKYVKDFAYNQFVDTKKLQNFKTDIVTEMLKIKKPTVGKNIYAELKSQIKDYLDSGEVDVSEHTIKTYFSLSNFFHTMSRDSKQIHSDLQKIYSILRGRYDGDDEICRICTTDSLAPFAAAYVRHLFPDCKVYKPEINKLCVAFTFNPKKILKEAQQQYKDDKRKTKV